MATLKLAADGVIRIDHDYMLSPEHEESYGHFLAAFARTVQLRLGETVETERLTQESEHRAARRHQFLDTMNAQFAKLSANVEAWKAESAERKEWDATTGDGQEPDGR